MNFEVINFLGLIEYFGKFFVFLEGFDWLFFFVGGFFIVFYSRYF